MGRIWRAYHADLAGQRGERLLLSPAEAHHVRNVLRLECGSPLRLFDGRGAEWQANISGISNRGVEVELQQAIEIAVEPPVSRLEDWVVSDDSGAIWVQYSAKLPFPTTSHEVWRIVRVSGAIALDKNGTPYVVPAKVEWEGLTESYSVLPALCSVAIHRFGGPQGLDHHIYWYGSSGLSVIDRKSNWHAQTGLRSGQVYDLETAFKRAKFYDLPPTIGEPCQGCIRYQIAAVHPKEGRPYFVTIYEGSVPEKLQAFIDLAITRTADAKPVE